MESDCTEWSSGIGSAACPTSVPSLRSQEAANPFSPCYLGANIKTEQLRLIAWQHPALYLEIHLEETIENTSVFFSLLLQPSRAVVP